MSIDYRDNQHRELIKNLLNLADSFEIQAITEGRNSQIFEVTTSTQEKFAVKFYPLPHLKNDYRDRLGTETKTLLFLESHGIVGIPKVINLNQEDLIVGYSWLYGQKIDKITHKNIDNCIYFLDQIASLSHVDNAEQLFDLASAPCLSIQSLIDQINERLDRLLRVGNPNLEQYLKNFQQIYSDWISQIDSSLSKALISHEIEMQQRILIPADFGFHNILEYQNELYFFDFEYFGYDDPIRLIGDILWHPDLRLSISDDLYHYYLNGLLNLCKKFYNLDILNQRFKALYPLYGFRWALITLNAFLFSGDIHIQKNQLEKANFLLDKIKFEIIK